MALLLIAVANRAAADEPIAASEPRLMSETAEITSVVDAFDDVDPFDLHLTLGFAQRWKHTNIRRETSLNQPGLSNSGFVASTENVASYSQSTSTFNLGADIGLYRDLALLLRLPIILNDSRQLADLDGASATNPQRMLDAPGQASALPLFSAAPSAFKSPERSGLDYLAIGLRYAIFNQQRDRHKPTWVVGLEGRIGVGEPLHACNQNTCPAPNDPTPTPLHGGTNRSPGISRATNALQLQTIFSRRFGYVEPFTGFSVLYEVPQARSDMGADGELKGALLANPPVVGTFSIGAEVIPWEQREQFRRFVIGARLFGEYHSPGREYTELFDALGSSPSPILRTPNSAMYTRDDRTGSPVGDPTSRQVYFTGITDQQQFGAFGGRLSLTWQAGEYIKFNGGLGLTYAQSHVITAADACNPSIKSNTDIAGPCVVGGVQTGIPNPNHRPILDTPGRRFVADDTTLVDLSASLVLMF